MGRFCCAQLPAFPIQSPQPSPPAPLLSSARLIFHSETELQQHLASLLAEAGFTFSREHALSRRDRIDFLVEPGVGLEVKLGGSPAPIVVQLARYAVHTEISELVLVTTSLRHKACFPREIGGKAVTCIHLTGSSL